MLADLRRMARICAALPALLCASLVHADLPQVGVIEDVRCSVSYHGPDLLHHGYFPVGIELENQGEESVVVEIEIGQQWQTEDHVTKRVRLEPGERSAFEPLLRARTNSLNTYNVQVEVSGESTYFAVGPGEWSGGFEVPILFAGRSAVEAGAVERWADAWSAPSSNQYRFAAVRFPELSEQWAAYSCYEWVVLALDEGLPDDAALDAIFAWVRTGGRIVIVAQDPRAALGGRPEDLKWMTTDYAVRERQPDAFEAFHFGHGTVTLAPQDDPGAFAMENDVGGSPLAYDAVDYWRARSWTPSTDVYGETGMLRVSRMLDDFGELPLRGFMVLLVLFALLMGPVNFWWVKRSKKPMLLLVTLPGISIVTSLGLVLFGVISQGLDVKVSTRSYTFLDQPARTATTAEVRRVFAGSSPGVGMRPQAGTAVFPEERFWSSNFRASAFFTRDLTNGRLLGGDFLPVREPVVQLIMSDRPMRLRLDVTEVGGTIEVANAFDGPIERLMLRDMQGELHQLNGELAAGESRRLVGNVGLQDREPWWEEMHEFWDARGSGKPMLPRGSYVAVLQTEALRDDCGIEVTEVSGHHVVFGVFEVGAEQ